MSLRLLLPALLADDLASAQADGASWPCCNR